MSDIKICICTRRRQQGLERLLCSIENMFIPSGVELEIIVIENDCVNYSENQIKSFAANSNLRIKYHLETRQGIAFARNRAVKEAKICDFCCFVDDDEIVSQNWLFELLKCQIEFNADGVWGFVSPIFNRDVPLYIKQFHKQRKFRYGTVVQMAATNCLLLRKEYLDMIKGPFDVRLNYSGGEDIYLTYNISSKGGLICFNPNAVVYENIPNERTTFKYLIQRTFRNRNTSYLVESLINPNIKTKLFLVKETSRLFYGLLLIIPYLLFSRKNRLKGILTITESVGFFYFFLGGKNKFYK